MTDSELRDLLKKGTIYNQYLLIGDEPLLIDNSITAIKDALKINESFDLDTYSIAETPVEEIVEKFYLFAFASSKRLLVVKNLEEIDNKELQHFAELINRSSSSNCIIMTYKIDKENKSKKYDAVYKKIMSMFNNTRCVTFLEGKELIHKWIVKTINRRKLNLSSSIIHYLENEFKNDITGLKNEFEKIENYLCEAKQMGNKEIADLAKGLCDFDKYQMVNTFLQGRQESLSQFEELKPYLHSYAELVDALIRSLISQIRVIKGDFNMADFLDEILRIDRKVKTSSYFSELFLELFLLKNYCLLKRGVGYGR